MSAIRLMKESMVSGMRGGGARDFGALNMVACGNILTFYEKVTII